MVGDGDLTQSGPAPPSERSFGLLFAGVAAAAAIWCAWRDRNAAAILLAGFAAALIVAALTAPAVLAAPNRLWFRLGMLLNRVVSPVVLGAIFFLIVTPVGYLRRIAGSDTLRLKLRAGEPSYWVARETTTPEPNSFKNQF